MIEAYFEQVEGVLREFANLQAYTLTRKVYNLQQGYIGGTITFEIGYHPEIPTFPHHKHTVNAIVEAHEPTLRDILLEIAQLEHRSAIRHG